MTTSSQIKAGLDDIAGIIRDQRAVMEKTKSNASLASTALADIPTTYAGVIAAVQAFGTTNAFEALAKAELAKLNTEYTALKAHADTIAATDLDS